MLKNRVEGVGFLKRLRNPFGSKASDREVLEITDNPKGNSQVSDLFS